VQDERSEEKKDPNREFGSGSPAREDHPPRKCLSLKQQAKICTRFGHLFSHGSLTIARDPNGINRMLKELPFYLCHLLAR
jgi:hypothetical protein